MQDESTMMKPFQVTGRRFGYDDVSATFYPFKEFKTTWQRCGSRAELKVTDYLQNANVDILGDFADCLFTRIQRHRKEIYTERLRAWLQSPEFVKRNQPLYLDRSRNLAYSPQGSNCDLTTLLEGLRDQGLINDGQGAFICWTNKPNRYRLGYCSILMKVVAISSALDSPTIPQFVTEYVLYHELLHLENGLESLRSQHDPAFRRQERRYPRWREAETWLKKVAGQKVS